MFIGTGYAQLSLYFVGPNDPDPYVCTFGVGDGLAEPDSAMLTDFMENWVTNIMPVLSEDIVLVGGQLRVGPVPSGPTYEVQQSPPEPGGKNQAAAIQNTALLVRKIGDLGGRKNRGRVFIPGIPAIAVGANGIIGSSAYGEILTAFEDFMLACIADGIDQVILHTDEDDVPTHYTNLAPQVQVATQRRRLRH